MKIKDLVELSITNITHRKLRAWLTLLGIVIGVAALVSIVSLGQGLSTTVNSSLGDFGSDIITLSAGFNRASGGAFGGFRGRDFEVTSSTDSPELTKKDVLVLKKNSNIKSIMESVSENLEVEYLSKKSTTQIQGINQQYWNDFYSYDFDSGRKLNVSDGYVVVIGYSVANTRFDKAITIGRKISIDGKSFSVVGILKEGESDNSIIIPLEVMWGMTDKEKDTYSQIKAKLIDLNESDDKIIFSEKEVYLDEKKHELEKFKVGDIVAVKVSGLVDFGIFVEFGVENSGLEGLIHISELAWQRIEHPRDLFKVGDKLKAQIISIENDRVTLSAKKILDDPWKKAVEKYEVGQTIKGKVVKFDKFGVFVELDKNIHGLVHISELSDKKVNAEDVVKIGKEYKFVILSIEPEDHRIGLSLKGVK